MDIETVVNEKPLPVLNDEEQARYDKLLAEVEVEFAEKKEREVIEAALQDRGSWFNHPITFNTSNQRGVDWVPFLGAYTFVRRCEGKVTEYHTADMVLALWHSAVIYAGVMSGTVYLFEHFLQ